MRLGLISPRLALQKGDFLGSGVPYWPLELATLAAFLREHGEDPLVFDLFGTDPRYLEDRGDHYLQGVPVSALRWRERLFMTDAFLIFAISFMSHAEMLAIIAWLKREFPEKRIAVLENAQAVTAFAIDAVATGFFEAGADLLVCGEPYANWDEIRACIATTDAAIPENVMTCPASPLCRKQIKAISYPVPAWDLFPIERYWALPYAHGPKTGRYLPVLTSRGCPYPCDFCVIPGTNGRRWHGNAPEAVADELIALRDRFGVWDFHVEDVNPTVRHERWERICEILIERQAGIRFYFVSGTKAETVHINKIELLARGGCRYISISPESGGNDVMRAIGKSFNRDHGRALVAECRRVGIRTQACFLVGHPAETETDFVASRRYLKDLVRNGLDEAAIFIVAPFAGSALHSRQGITINDTAAMASFSPKGRADFALVERRRRDLIRVFFRAKLGRGLDLWRQGLRAVFGTPQTKMENLPRRAAYVLTLTLLHMLGIRRCP